MRFHSTRSANTCGLDDALLRGIAGDGGLFVPESLPSFAEHDFDGANSLTDIARVLLQPFFAESTLSGELDTIIAETLHFPIPLRAVEFSGGQAWILELFHGPTAAFKDVGAGFLAACVSRLNGDNEKPLVILVATSGDTGGAVAAAFDGRPGTQVVVLYPQGRVSPRQAKQLTCWSDNVISLEVRGSFDDCQAMVKSAFADRALSTRYRFSSANSINIGRLLPQSTYYAYASLDHLRRTGSKPGFIIPTGNLGNGLACILARDMGLPIGDIILATNANRLISDYLEGAEWLPRASVQTLATAMDVGNPSNMERLQRLHGDAKTIGSMISSVSVNDEQIRMQIKADFAELGIAHCPHTATASYALQQLPAAKRRKDWILVGTAHAAKFETVVEPLIGEAVPVPEPLEKILSRPGHFRSIDAGIDALALALDKGLPGAADGQRASP